MYEYRKLTPEEKTELVRQRRARGNPPHSPPHRIRHQKHYLLSAACYEHKCHLSSEMRRQQFMDLFFEVLVEGSVELHAWAVLPNHYHLLVHLEDFGILSGIFRAVHGPTAKLWNTEEDSSGRKVWYGYTDRAIRSERHYFTTLNYIHYNPVKHKWAESPYGWPQSSVHWYLQHYRREWLQDLWVSYPVREYGEGWDDL
jgi:putative transposase